MKEDVKLPFECGFFLRDHALLTNGGVCMPLLGRQRDEALYVLCALSMDPEGFPVDHDVVVMHNKEVKAALKYGSVSYHSTTKVELKPYHVFKEEEAGTYLRFAVKVTDIDYEGLPGQVFISEGCVLNLLESTEASTYLRPVEGSKESTQENNRVVTYSHKGEARGCLPLLTPDTTYLKPTTGPEDSKAENVACSILMHHKRNEVGIKEPGYDADKADKIMKAIKPKKRRGTK